jgi:hypothetical protein
MKRLSKFGLAFTFWSFLCSLVIVTNAYSTGGQLTTRAIQTLDAMFSNPTIKPFSFPVVWTGCTWTNAQVVALGASLTGDITCVATLPAKTAVTNTYMVITGQAAGVTTLTAAVGRVAAAYIDYIVASDAKAAVNTVYGDASAERGTNLVGYDLPSYTAATVIKIHFISTVQNLDQTTGSSGRVILKTEVVP